MIAQRVWALISENEVKNTIVCENYPTADMLAKNSYGNEAFAEEITQTPTAIGHTYKNGVFKNSDGDVVEPLPTSEEEVKHLKSKNDSLNQSIAELTMMVNSPK